MVETAHRLDTLRDRGLDWVRPVISDAHAGLNAAIARVFKGRSWQRCKVHAMRNILAAVAAISAVVTQVLDGIRARGPATTG